MSGRFSGARVLVTGGACGSGLATAELLTAEGASVVIVDRDATAAHAHAERLGTSAVVADLADPEEVEDAVTQATAALGAAPALLAHCAGIRGTVPLARLDADTWDRVLTINLRAAMLVGRAMAAALAHHPGSFVFLSSVAAVRGTRTQPAAHIAASKAGLLGLVRQMAVEWAPQVRVNAVSPGVIEDGRGGGGTRASDGPASLEDRIPLGRHGSTADVAAAIAFLLSDEAGYITGVNLPVDGGVTIT